jgi:hypothetical protein
VGSETTVDARLGYGVLVIRELAIGRITIFSAFGARLSPSNVQKFYRLSLP